MIITATLSSSMTIQGACHYLLACSSTHRLQPVLQPLPLNPYRSALTSARASSLSTWPKPRSNKNQQISLGCTGLSLRESCIHSPAVLMLNVAPVYLHLYCAPFRHREMCFFNCLTWLWRLLEAPVSVGMSQEGCNDSLHSSSCRVSHCTSLGCYFQSQAEW